MPRQDQIPNGTRMFTVYLPLDEYLRLKMTASEERRPMVRVVREALADYHERHRIEEDSEA